MKKYKVILINRDTKKYIKDASEELFNSYKEAWDFEDIYCNDNIHEMICSGMLTQIINVEI